MKNLPAIRRVFFVPALPHRPDLIFINPKNPSNIELQYITGSESASAAIHKTAGNQKNHPVHGKNSILSKIIFYCS
jgi:hypothetical protein